MTPEGLVVRDIKTYIRSLGGEVRKCQWVGHVGAPDLFIMLDGLHFWLEVKAIGGKLASHQEREIERMKKAGAIVEVVYGFDQALEVIDEIRSRNF